MGKLLLDPIVTKIRIWCIFKTNLYLKNDQEECLQREKKLKNNRDLGLNENYSWV